MFLAYARLIVRKPVAWTVVVIVLLLAAAAGLFANRVIQDDDLLAFLPKKNPEVAGFYDVADRFGSMDVALVGIESEDVFDPDFLARLKDLTKRLNETPGLEYTLSITSVEDFAADREKGGITTDYLVREIPKSDAERAALREKVLSRDHIVGNLVSEDGRAVMLYCFATPGSQPRAVAASIRGEVERSFPNEKKYWHGSPFIATYIYDVTQKDIRRLAPWACLAIALVVLLSFKDVIGTGLSLLTTMFGVIFPLGIMGFANIHTNIVLGSMPVILFALGSAYGVHVLTRFYGLSVTLPREEAIVHTLTEVGPSVLGSGITTSFGLLSFVMMDIPPMRTFGIFTAIGLTIALLLALSFIPAVLAITPLKGRVKPTMVWLSEWMVSLSLLSQRKKLMFGGATAIITVAATFYATKVDSRLDTTAFFDAGSPPDQADSFMRRHFGGSQFIQVQIKADMNDPATLREVQLLSDRIALLDGVSSVTHIGSIVATLNEAMDDTRHVPDTPEKVKLLYTFLAGKRAVAQTVTDDRDFALITVKVIPSKAAEVEAILHQIEELTDKTLPKHAAVATLGGARDEEIREHRAEIVAARISALAHQYGTRVAEPAKLRDALASRSLGVDNAVVEKGVLGFMKTEAFDAPLPSDAPADAKEKIAHEAVLLGPPPTADKARKTWRAKMPAAVARGLGKEPTDPSIDDISLALEQNIGDVWVREGAAAQSSALVAAAGLTIPEGPKGERLRTFIGHSLLDLDVPGVLLSSDAGAATVSPETLVTGLPVLYRGLSDSVFNNQWNSLWFALVLVIGLKALLFRNFWTGILTSVPTFVTLLVVYGGMGLIGVHLDMGTSMLASLIIGAGDDYAVQYLWSWSASAKAPLSEAARAASFENGAAVWINALEVALGFFVLTLGEARPLQNVGGLTAVAMLAAALATFVICPLLARKRHYAPTPPPAEAEAPAAEAALAEEG